MEHLQSSLMLAATSTDVVRRASPTDLSRHSARWVGRPDVLGRGRKKTLSNEVYRQRQATFLP